MDSKINFSIILFSLLFSHSLSVETAGTRLVRQRFSEGRFCMDQTDYPEIVRDQHAMKLYVQKLCSRVSPSMGSAHITNTYGSKIKVMGQGSFGKVYKYKKGTKLYAVKVPSNFEYKDVFKELNGSECIKEMLKDNAELQHMAFIFECVYSRNTPHMIMKFLPMTLREYVLKFYKLGWASLSSADKTKMLTQMYIMSKALNALHEKEIAHRDLKPENIMVTPKATPILVDFGLLTPMGDMAKTLAGTPYYLDYEVMNRNSQGTASDVYSLLMTFVFMIHGQQGGAILNSVLTSGGYDQVSKGLKSSYTPSFSKTNLPSEFAWMQNMFVPSRNGRWKMPQVVTQFESMLGIASVPKEEPKDQMVMQNKEPTPQILEISPKPEIKKMVVEKPASEITKFEVERPYKNKYLVNERPVSEITKFEVERVINKPKVEAREYKPSGQAQIMQAKVPQFGRDDRQFRNKYLDLIKPKQEVREQEIQDKEEMPVINVRNNYYRYEYAKKQQQAPNEHFLDRDRMARFQDKMNALNKQIQEMQDERKEKQQLIHQKVLRAPVGRRKGKHFL